jgi:iron complex outermembrane receptor protein
MNKPLMQLCLMTAACSAFAQPSTGVTEQDYFSDMPVVLSVSRLPQRLDETPGALTVLDRDFIRQSGARDVADLLRLVPGFQSSASFYSTAPLASYHGAFDAYSIRMQVMVDGRSVYSPYFIGSVGPGLQTVALQDIERIEVLRGSNSAAYGARALLGVVNIVTQHTSDTLGAQAALTLGQNGVGDAQARLGWESGRATHRLTLDERADDGLVGSNGHNLIRRFNFRSDFFTAAGDDVQVRLGNYAIDAGNGFPKDVGNPLRTNTFDSNYIQVNWHRNLSQDEDLAASWSHGQEDYGDQFPFDLKKLGINGTYIVNGSGKASSDTLSLQHTFRANPSTRAVWGGEFRSEKVSSVGLYATDAAFQTDFYRLFGNVEWRAQPSVLINAGALAEKESVTGQTVSPRLMANWNLLPGQTLRAGVSTSYRPPSTFEKFGNVRYVWNGILLREVLHANGNVVPERLDVKELGYLGDFPQWHSSLDVRIYHEKINGFIRQLNDSLLRDYVNDENFAIQGWEYQFKWRPWTGAEFILNQGSTNIGSVRENKNTAYAAPKRAATLIYFQKFPNGVDLTLSHQDNGTATLASGNMSSLTPMTRTDLRLGWPIRWGTHAGEMAVTVQNLGSPYQDYFVGHYFERRAFVTLRLDR